MTSGSGPAKTKTMLVLACAASLALAGCAVDTQSTVDEMTEAPDTTEAVVIDESGNGQSFDVIEGQRIILRLPGNPTTGYEWTVASTDRTFGYPSSEQYLADDGGAGSGGTYEFVWSTDRVLSVVGTHTVVMHYGRSWEQEPIDEFTFTVEVVAAAAER